MPTLVYLLEDDPDIARLIERSLGQSGFTTRIFRRMADFEREVRRQTPDLCLIDLALPDGDGLDLVSNGVLPRTVPRVIVTGRGAVTDRVVGLEIGADDYIVKPFEPRELVARLRAVLRRSRMVQETAGEANRRLIARFGGWKADLGACRLQSGDGTTLGLSSAETTLLEAFLRAPGRVLSRSNLMDATGGRHGEPFDRSMDARISRLRRKLDAHSQGQELIRTVYGAGYILTADVTWEG